MKYDTYKKIMQCLGTAFSKQYDETELKVFYRYFKDYDEDVFMEAIDRAVTSYDRLPSIKQLIDICEQSRISITFKKEYEKIGTPEPDQEWYDILNSFK